jgi:DNA-binding CsgD family transcriptional regulator
MATPRPLTAHQLDTLRLYDRLGSYEAVADFRGVSVGAVDNTLRLIRVKLQVRTSAEALGWLHDLGVAT